MEFTEKGIVQATQFAIAGQKIFDAIKEGVMAAKGVAGLGTGGISEAMGLITQSVIDAVTTITAKFNSLVTAAYNFGYGWVTAIIDGINARLGDLEELLAYIRGLFPSSPAKYGPWKTLPDGETVGAGFALGMAQGLWGGSDSLVAAMGNLRNAFGMNGGYGGFGGVQPAMATAGNGPVTININNPTVRNDRDITALAAAVGDVLARQAMTNSRLART
jgi:hypothetical protein